MRMREFSSLKILNHICKDNPYPVSVEIDPSNICNFNCSWCCFKESKSKSPTMIEGKLFLKIVKELAELGIKSITFTGGGEPLMNESTLNAIILAYKKGIKVGLVTNGNLFFGLGANCMKYYEFIRISLDAGTDKTYQKVHKAKKGDFLRTTYNIGTLSLFKKKNHTIGISFLVHPDNYREIYKAAKLSKELGVDYFQIKPIYYLNSVKHTRIWLKAKPYIDKALKLSDNKFRVFSMNYRFNDMVKAKRNYKKCRIHNYLTIIGADSKVYLCCPYRGNEKFCLGDLKKNTFKEIWNSKRRKKVINSIDMTKCPYCRHNDYNEILEYMGGEHPHGDFL